MYPLTREGMGYIVRALIRDCLVLMNEAALTCGDLATLLGTSRLTVQKWSQHMKTVGDWKTLHSTGGSPAHLFMNLLIIRQALTRGLASADLPAPHAAAKRAWMRRVLGETLE